MMGIPNQKASHSTLLNYFSVFNSSMLIVSILVTIVFYILLLDQIRQGEAELMSFGVSASSKKSKIPVVLIRVLLITLTNILCWGPVVVVSLASFADINIPATAVVIIAVVIMPMNPLINPMIYTLTAPNVRQYIKSAIQEKCTYSTCA